jgi:glycosyltransferase involved in cell wall biosynthesis
MDSIFSIGGVQRVTAVIAKSLASYYDVTIVTFDSPSSQDTKLYGLEEADIQYRFVSYPATGKFKKCLCRAYSGFYRKMQPEGLMASNLYARSSFPSELRQALVRELQQGRYDTVIGVHAPLAARLATLMPSLPGVRCVGWIHNSFEALFSPSSRYIGSELKRHYVYQFQKLHATVLLCQHDADSYKAYDSRLKPTVIYNPLTLVPGRPSDGTSKRFLAVGRFSPMHKGFDLLIKAFRLFAEKETEWVLDIVGEGPEEDLYRRMIADYHLEQRVFLHPFTNRIQDYYSNAQVYVLSSRWEGFGLVLVEAMAHGLPVVSSNLPTSREIMGDFGLYFDNEDIAGLAERLYDATQLDWKKKSAEAFPIASNFNLSEIALQWRAILRSK